MTWNLHLTGHSDTPEEEAEVLEKARELTTELEEKGATSSQFSGMHSGAHQLLPKNETDPAEE